jgi:SAM-dependent methyltransferase
MLTSPNPENIAGSGLGLSESSRRSCSQRVGPRHSHDALASGCQDAVQLRNDLSGSQLTHASRNRRRSGSHTMNIITDDRGYNQIWAPSKATDIRAERRCDYIVSLMRPGSDETVLEIGCGIGTNAFLLACKTEKQILATDICRPFLDQAAKRYALPNLTFRYLDFRTARDVEALRVDYVVGNGILHHLYRHLDESLVEMRRLLKPNGRIIFLEPNLLNPYCWFIFRYPALRKRAKLEPDEMAFSKSFIETRLAAAGYCNIRVEYRDFLLPGVPAPLIRPSIAAGSVLERTPVLRAFAQSLFISADS